MSNVRAFRVGPGHSATHNVGPFNHRKTDMGHWTLDLVSFATVANFHVADTLPGYEQDQGGDRY